MDYLYPMMLALKGKRCLVVGGGSVALRKVKTLLDKKAEVLVVSPGICEDLFFLQNNHENKSNLKLVEKRYEKKDMEGIFLVFACTDNNSLNVEIAREAKKKEILVNCVSCPKESEFIVPATVSKGNLTISISTGGASPALSKKIKEKIEAEFSADWDKYVELLSYLRHDLQQEISTNEEQRKRIYYELLEDESIFEKAIDTNRFELKELSKNIIDGFI